MADAEQEEKRPGTIKLLGMLIHDFKVLGGLLAVVLAALIWSVTQVIAISASYRNLTAAIEDVRALCHDENGNRPNGQCALLAGIGDLEKRIAALENRRREEDVEPIRFADWGNKVEPGPPGGIVRVTWVFSVHRDDCNPPDLALHLRDSNDVTRSVAVVDFTPVKLPKSPPPRSLTYLIEIPKAASTGNADLWATLKFSCPGSKFGFVIVSPEVRVKVIVPDDRR